MTYYLQVCSSDGRIVRDDEPYTDFAAARDDAKFGARQIVGNALRSGISLRAATRGKTFEIVDEGGTVVDAMTFLDLVGLDRKT